MNENNIILCGNGLGLTQALKDFIYNKTEKLFRHERRILRVRVELQMESDKGRERVFVARGIVELHGPDLVASVQAKNAYTALDMMVDKLDRKLRHRHRRRLLKRARPGPIDLPASLPKGAGMPKRSRKRAFPKAA